MDKHHTQTESSEILHPIGEHPVHIYPEKLYHPSMRRGCLKGQNNTDIH